MMRNDNIKNDTVHIGKHDFEELSKKIIGAAIEVHRELWPGFWKAFMKKH
jgi:hypothetical protein